MAGILVDWYLSGSMKVKYFHRFLPPCCANKIAAEGKEFRLLMAAADLWFPELEGYEVDIGTSLTGLVNFVLTFDCVLLAQERMMQLTHG